MREEAGWGRLRQAGEGGGRGGGEGAAHTCGRHRDGCLIALDHVSVWRCPGWADVVTQTWSYWLLGQLHEHRAKDQARAVGFYKMVRKPGGGREIHHRISATTATLPLP